MRNSFYELREYGFGFEWAAMIFMNAEQKRLQENNSSKGSLECESCHLERARDFLLIFYLKLEMSLRPHAPLPRLRDRNDVFIYFAIL